MNSTGYEKKNPTQNGACVNIVLYDGIVSNDVSEDYILPDFLPDIAHILKVKTMPRLGGHFTGEDNLEFEGDILYSVLYEAENGDIKNVMYSDTFDGSTQVSAIRDDSTVMIVPQCENTSFRMLNPRKLNLRSKIGSHIHVNDELCMETHINGVHSIEDEINLEHDTTSAESAKIVYTSEKGLRISDNIELEGTMPQISEIISCDADIYISECKAAGNKYNLRGELFCSVLYSSDSGAVTSVSRRLPLSEQLDIPLDAAEAFENSGTVCHSTAAICELKYNSAANGYGENKIIEIDAEYAISISAVYNTSAEVTRDIYSTEWQCSAQSKNIVLNTLHRLIQTNFSVNLSDPRTEVGAENSAAVISSSAEVKLDSVIYDSERSKLTASGNIAVSMITMREGNNGIPVYGSVNYIRPVKCDIDGGNIPADFTYTISADIIGAKGRLDSTNIYGDFEIAMSVMLFSKRNITAIESVTLDKAITVSDLYTAPITLYYPSHGERIWDIAKKYHVTRQAVSALNLLGEREYVDAQTKVLIIPKNKSKSIYSTVI